MRGTDSRSFIGSVIPRTPVGNVTPTLHSDHNFGWVVPGICSSFIFDFVTRQKVAGMNMNLFIVKQLPLLSPAQLDRVDERFGGSGIEWLRSRLLELIFTSWEVAGFASDADYRGAPFKWDSARRELLRAEIDAALFHLYGIRRDDVDYIMDTFPIVKRKDESAHGEYRTKRLILERYDALAEAAASGTEYQTVLNPPPADPSCAHPESTRPEWA